MGGSRTMKWIARLFGLAFAIALLATTAQAQTLIGTVEGKVADEQGAVLPGVAVTMTGPRGPQTTVTDERGEYRFVGVQPGIVYRVKVELQGFAAQERTDVKVEIGTTTAADFTMKASALSVTID